MSVVLKRELTFFAVIIIFALAISLIALDMDTTNAMDASIRLLALNGYIALSVAAILTPFIKEVTLFSKNHS